jgi:hypothetical protein
MTTAIPPAASVPTPGIGETVHLRDAGRCWAAAIVDRGPAETAQLYVFPLPPSMPMPSNPGTFLEHDGGTTDDTWHRLAECGESPATPPEVERPRRSRRRSRAGA